MSEEVIYPEGNEKFHCHHCEHDFVKIPDDVPDEIVTRYGDPRKKMIVVCAPCYDDLEAGPWGR